MQFPKWVNRMQQVIRVPRSWRKRHSVAYGCLKTLLSPRAFCYCPVDWLTVFFVLETCFCGWLTNLRAFHKRKTLLGVKVSGNVQWQLMTSNACSVMLKVIPVYLYLTVSQARNHFESKLVPTVWYKVGCYTACSFSATREQQGPVCKGFPSSCFVFAVAGLQAICGAVDLGRKAQEPGPSVECILLQGFMTCPRNLRLKK